MPKITHFYFAVALLSILCLGNGNAVFAEGSREMASSGGDRVFLDYTDAFQAGLHRRTLIEAYLNAGESLKVGSSSNGLGTAKIVIRGPNAAVYTSNGASGVGVINNNVEEKAGPLPNAGGYKPYSIIADVSGIYEIAFNGPVTTNTASGTNYVAANPWTRAAAQPTDQAQTLAWDATVVDASGKEIKGRVYTNAFAGTMRNNSRAFSSLLYILTDQGWQYTMDANGMDPFGFIFIVNNRGNQIPGKKESAFKSVEGVNAKVHDPEQPDDTTITHKIFFNPPDPNMPSTAKTPVETTWLFNNPPPIPVIEDFHFVGIEGTIGAAGYGMGGSFYFNTNLTGRYQLTIDMDGNGKTTDPVDVGLLADMQKGANIINWDGKDGLGSYVLPGVILSKAVKLNAEYAEVHFPLYDAEANPKGFILTRMNGPDAPDTLLYWNDKAFTDATSFTGGLDGTMGKSSAAGAHKWTYPGGGKGGDTRMIDSWGYINYPEITINAPIYIRSASLYVENQKISLAFLSVGDKITITADIVNNGPSDVSGVGIYVELPAEFTGASNILCSSSSMLNNCDAPAIHGSTLSVNSTIKFNTSIKISVTVTLSKKPAGALSSIIGVLRPNDYFDPQATKPIIGGFAQSLSILKSQCADAGYVSPSCDNLSTLSIIGFAETQPSLTPTPNPTPLPTPKPIDPVAPVPPAPDTSPSPVPSPQVDPPPADPEQYLKVLLDKIKEAKESQPKEAPEKPKVPDVDDNFAPDFAKDTLACDPYLKKSVNKKSPQQEINDLRFLLNDIFKANLPTDGPYDKELQDTVKKYQEYNLNKITILKASGIALATGIVDEYTMAQLNVDFCYFKLQKRCPYFFDYLDQGEKNGTKNKLQDDIITQVDVWKEFLNLLFPESKLVYNGQYDKPMKTAVGKYHTRYKRTILSPWRYANPKASVTYYLREASRNWANYMVKCPEGPIELYDGSGNVNYY